MEVVSVADIDSIGSDERYNTTLVIVSKREQEVLQLMSKGLTVKEIAHALYLSTHTIISHKKNLIEKLEARNSIELVVKAIRLNVIDIGE